ncbi:MAG: SDR family oxidoreductase [Pseudonocardiaceae bacterium]|nr:SDR family oxidoreductase [Pseudonocardiaceae bacterium]
MTDFDLSRRIAWVTGAGKGLGKAMVEALANAGATVALTARTEKDIQNVASSLRHSGHNALALPGSVAKSSAVDALVKQIVDEYGRIDVLVNCAGISPVFKRSERLTDDEWSDVLGVNLSGTFNCCRAAGAHMLRSGAGSIVNVSSVHGTTGFPRVAAYAASKGGVEALTRALAVEWADRGVRVNTIAPGYFRTELSEGLLSSKWSDTIQSRIPQNRYGHGDDLAGAVVFLASDASRYVTGSTMFVDGGWTAH